MAIDETRRRPVTTLTIITLIVVVVGVLSTRGYPVALAIGGATPVGAALLVGENAIPTFYATAIGAAAGLVIGLLVRTRRFERSTLPAIPGLVALLLFAVWSIVVTLAAPLLFNGLTVLGPGGVERGLSASTITTSNIAQIVYLLLGVCVIVFLARARETGPWVIGLAAGLATVLSFWAWLHQFGLPYPEGVFDNSPTFVFIDSLPGGAPRFRGIFSEPAGLATSSLVTIAYMTSRIRHVRGFHRVGTVTVMLIAVFLASISTSATFVVAGVAVLALAAATFLAKFVLRRGPLSPLTVTISCFAAIVGIWVLPMIAAAVSGVVTEKVASDSFTERSGSDTLSYSLVLDTFGVGVGLGAHRPSSFLGALLATTGIVGTVLFVVAVGSVIRASLPLQEYRPVVWALIALLVTKVVSGPDLADTSGILWMSLGVLAHGAVQARRTPSEGSPPWADFTPSARFPRDQRALRS